MTMKTRLKMWGGILILAVIVFALTQKPFQPSVHRTVQAAPTISTVSQADHAAKQYAAALDVARVFGRAPGCTEAEPKLITEIANEALNTDLDPRVFAATVAVESGCSQYATSNHGAVGLMQITPRIWKGSYDFETQYNLFNPRDNIHVGSLILSSFVKQYGLVNGLRHYNGTGATSDAYDAEYTTKILSLAGRK